MGTRSRIAIKNPDASYTSIYVHWDGYPSHHGPILTSSYTTPAQVNALMKLGDLSSLAPKLGKKHGFDNAPEDECNAYKRDRGESDTEAERSADLSALLTLTQETGGEFLYVFDDGVWYVAGGASSAFGMPANKQVSDMKKLEDAMKEKDE